MGDYTPYGKDSLSWRQIVLEHIQKILECSRTEFHGGYWQDVGSNPSTRTYIPDTRQTYVNAIKALADVLIPFFDDEMIKVNDEIEEWCESPNLLAQLYEARINEVIQRWNNRMEAYNKNPKTTIKPSRNIFMQEKAEANNMDFEEAKVKTSKLELRYRRRQFQELNLLLHRQDYLKSAVYSEGDLEEDDAEVEEMDK